MTDIERNILLNQFVIMSALETMIREKTQDYVFESKQLNERMEAIANVLDSHE